MHPFIPSSLSCLFRGGPDGGPPPAGTCRVVLHRSSGARLWQVGLRAAVAAVAAVQLAGCATTQLEAQWANPQVPAQSLRGQRLLVACEAPEMTLQRLCEERMAAEVVARGGTPVLVQELVATPGTDVHLSAARSTGAAAALVVRVSEADARVSGPVSVGLGGFGFGGGGVVGGLGVSVPLGGGRKTVGYATSARLVKVPEGQLMWTARASAAPSGDPAAQLAELARSTLEGAHKAGYF